MKQLGDIVKEFLEKYESDINNLDLEFLGSQRLLLHPSLSHPISKTLVYIKIIPAHR